MEIINWVKSNGDTWLEILGATVALATLIVKLTPSTKDDSVVTKIIQVLSALSLCNADGTFVQKGK